MHCTPNELIAKRLPSLVELRHAIHAHPELGFEEHETARRVLERLEKLKGLRIRSEIAGTGIVATLNAEAAGPCVALRADMDALPITEQTEAPYASRIPGKMHACGHDGHTACLVGAAEVLWELKDQLRGPVKFIFQPAEEGRGGGEAMCQAGLLGDPPVAAIFGMHGWPWLDLGTVSCAPGPNMASADEFHLTVIGQEGHGAIPHEAVDPIVVAAHIITALQTIVSRSTNPTDAVVITIGAFHAGTVSNVIPAEASLVGTLRTLDPNTRERCKLHIARLASSVAEGFGARIDLRFAMAYPVLINDNAATSYFLNIASETLGSSHVDGNPPVTMGAEDFAYYGQLVPAAFWRLGVRRPGATVTPLLHQSTYDFPDEAIPLAVRLHVESTLNFAKRWVV